MRRTRRLILVLIAVLVASVAFIYTIQKQIQARESPSPPKSLPASVSATAMGGWEWEDSRGGKPHVRVKAKAFLHNAETNHLDLTGVELHLFHKDAKAFDRVKSEKADFDLTAGLLFSEGDVEITMGVAADPTAAPRGRLMTIRTSGVRFDNKTGKAWTDRKAAFVFERGSGESVGAQYDPASRELHMHRNVKLQWQGENTQAPPMHVEAGSLVYKEAANEVWLTPWSRFRRETLTMDGGNAVVKLEEGAIRTVDAIAARGVDKGPTRTLEYSADAMNLRFGPGHIVEHVNGSRNARLVSSAPTSQTTVNSDEIDLEFAPTGDESMLTRARAS
ncbi:MAG TPA: LPS export ABC transporter periplasmic protein LptC, partial [Bryobacteraceae bacterium]|nr:LPS export ABC transporter periplasmic protein LptC [Bryobacteraceae bacterium]